MMRKDLHTIALVRQVNLQGEFVGSGGGKIVINFMHFS